MINLSRKCVLASLTPLVFAVISPVYGQTAEETISTDSLTHSIPQVDTLDSTLMDSARLERVATQDALRKEIAAFSQSQLGTDEYVWTYRAEITIERAGQSQLQEFWYNPEEPNGPAIWKPKSERSREVFYLDPATGRAATLNLDKLEGSYIPARIAEQAGFTGNPSVFLPKKSKAWTQNKQSDQGPDTWTKSSEGETLTISLMAEKDADCAQAIYQWICLQPIEALDLPAVAQKFPIQSIESKDANGVTRYRLECTVWEELEQPVVLDSKQLTIRDPERDLKTVAREWADQKAQETQKD